MNPVLNSITASKADSTSYRDYLHKQPHTSFTPCTNSPQFCHCCDAPSLCASTLSKCAFCDLVLCASCRSTILSPLCRGDLKRCITERARWKNGWNACVLNRMQQYEDTDIRLFEIMHKNVLKNILTVARVEWVTWDVEIHRKRGGEEVKRYVGGPSRHREKEQLRSKQLFARRLLWLRAKEKILRAEFEARSHWFPSRSRVDKIMFSGQGAARGNTP